MSDHNTCFQRNVRLTQKADFNRVFAGAKKISDRYFTVLIRVNELSYPRLGLAVSKKVAKSAVVRNRIKRLIRESFRLQQHNLNGLDIVVIARSGLHHQTNSQLFNKLQNHWHVLSEQCATA